MSNMKETRLAYPLDLIQRIGDYLIQRPYGEVAHLIDGLKSQGVQVETELKEEKDGE